MCDLLTEFNKDKLVVSDSSLESVFLQDQDTLIFLDFISPHQDGER